MNNQSIADKNIRIANLAYPEHEIVIVRGVTGVIRDKNGNIFALPDYYNNIADLWPLIVEHKIASLPQAYGNGLVAHNLQGTISVHRKKPLHALADCIFLVLDARARNEQSDETN